MCKEEMTEIIFERIKKVGSLSFVEVERLFIENGYDYEGSIYIGTASPSIIVWGFWKQEAIDIILELKKRGVQSIPTSPLIYFYDGKALNFPLATNLRGYKNDLHWLPVVLTYKSN